MHDELEQALRSLGERRSSLDLQTRSKISQQASRRHRRRGAARMGSVASVIAATVAALTVQTGLQAPVAADFRPLPQYVEVNNSGDIDFGQMRALFSESTSSTEISRRFVREVLEIEPESVAPTKFGADEAYPNMHSFDVRTAEGLIRTELFDSRDKSGLMIGAPFGPWISTVINDRLTNFSEDFAYPVSNLLVSSQNLTDMQQSQSIDVDLPALPCEANLTVKLRTWQSTGARTVGKAVQAAYHDEIYQYRLNIPYNIEQSTLAFAVVTCESAKGSEFLLARPLAILSANTVADEVHVTLAGARLNMKSEDNDTATSIQFQFQRRFVTGAGFDYVGEKGRTPLWLSVTSGVGQLSPESQCRVLQRDMESTLTIELDDPKFRCAVKTDQATIVVLEVRPGLTAEIHNIWVRDANWQLTLSDWQKLTDSLFITEEFQK